jgi:hypothetical protein
MDTSVHNKSFEFVYITYGGNMDPRPHKIYRALSTPLDTKKIE